MFRRFVSGQTLSQTRQDVHDFETFTWSGDQHEMAYLARAQVHATLALAAATAEGREISHTINGDYNISERRVIEWEDAFKTPKEIAEMVRQRTADSGFQGDH